MEKEYTLDKYTYPAVFIAAETGGYSVVFPDIPGCVTKGDNITSTISMAKEALEQHLYLLEKSNSIIPEPSKPELINLDMYKKEYENPHCFVMVIEAYMPLIRHAMSNKSITKSITIPAWLNDLALKKDLNFSQILQVALKDILGIKNY